jgi:DnaK suppressor protein
MASKKKSPGKKAARKASKPAARKKVSKKKVAKKKVAKKPSTKKTAAKKKVAKKPSTKKTATKKKASKKKAGKKTASKKKVAKKKTTSAKRPAARKTGANGAARRRKAVLSGDIAIHGIAPYRPRKGESYMSESQLEHFTEILGAWKAELMKEVDRTVHHMQDEASNFPDPNDRATQESEFGLELRTRDRERKLLKKIAQAMERIEDGSYGFCEETGEEIGLQRLEARPVATLSVEAQERRELAERQFSDRDDQYR